METDNDYIFCQYCGVKIRKDSDRIVIEHIERKIDEAEILKTKFEEKMFDSERKSSKKLWIYPNVIGIGMEIIASFLEGGIMSRYGTLKDILEMGGIFVLILGNYIAVMSWLGSVIKRWKAKK